MKILIDTSKNHSLKMDSDKLTSSLSRTRYVSIDIIMYPILKAHYKGFSSEIYIKLIYKRNIYSSEFI